MTKLTDLKEGDCYISPIHGRPVVRAVNPPDALPMIWAWSRLGSAYRQPEEVAVYEKTDLTLIEHYSTHPTPTPLTPLAKKEPDKRWIKDTEVRTGDRFYGYRGTPHQPGLESTRAYDDGPVVTVTGRSITHPKGYSIHNPGTLGGKIECFVSRENWDNGYKQVTGLLGDTARVRQAAKPFSFSGRVPNVIPGDMLNGVSLEEIVRRYELGMREERIVSYTDGKKYIRDRKASEVAAHGGRYMAGLDGAQFLVAQKEFTRLVKVKAAEARKAEKESVKVDRDTDYWNE